ncbi:MAG: 2-hydroxychromene-2-carboxylate isomerase [bacterium]
MNDSRTIDWYFDFISPFAYLQFRILQILQADRPDLNIHYKPVLFAALLQANDHKGPAEIPIKRLMTYRYCHWYAKHHDIDFKIPAAHPFNPLPLLRLAVARECTASVLSQLFNHVWVESAQDPLFYSLQEICKLPGLEHAAEEVDQIEVKNMLRSYTDEAIAREVFGVPTIAIGEMLFWGLDMTEMAMEYLDYPGNFDHQEYKRIAQLPIAKARI